MEIIVKGFALFKKLIELLKGILILFVALLQLYGVFVLLKKWIDKIKTKIKKTENNKDLEKVKTVK